MMILDVQIDMRAMKIAAHVCEYPDEDRMKPMVETADNLEQYLLKNSILGAKIYSL